MKRLFDWFAWTFIAIVLILCGGYPFGYFGLVKYVECNTTSWDKPAINSIDSTNATIDTLPDLYKADSIADTLHYDSLFWQELRDSVKKWMEDSSGDEDIESPDLPELNYDSLYGIHLYYNHVHGCYDSVWIECPPMDKGKE